MFQREAVLFKIYILCGYVCKSIDLLLGFGESGFAKTEEPGNGGFGGFFDSFCVFR